ncbi:UPF0175 family protein [Candidatus Micrarchaeota archaeon]|nr:UPF0175 family protein [Candidatus Micrarchaeota archaeon]MBI5177291.1 UPF0175 family protein [Candidatus Micrarchaeota archaeon]
MEQVISCRLEKKELEFIKTHAKEREESRGEILRQLLGEGRKMEALREYKGGKASLGKAASIAGTTISDFIDLLDEFGVHSNLTLEDFRESLLNLSK